MFSIRYNTIKRSDISGDFLAPDISACDSVMVLASEGGNHVYVGNIITEIAGQLRPCLTCRKEFPNSAEEKTTSASRSPQDRPLDHMQEGIPE